MTDKEKTMFFNNFNTMKTEDLEEICNIIEYIYERRDEEDISDEEILEISDV